MDFNLNVDTDLILETAEFRAGLLADGYAVPLANATTFARHLLAQGTVTLLDLDLEGPPTKDETILISAFNDRDDILPHDDVLLPAWEDFAGVLSRMEDGVDRRGYIHLILRGLRLERVYSLLLPSFRAAPPLKWLIFLNNDLGPDGLQFVARAVKAIPTLEKLMIGDIRVVSEEDAPPVVQAIQARRTESLIRAVKEHRKLTALYLSNCGIGHNDGVMSAITSAFHNLASVDLERNSIGARSAAFLADSLASNPGLNSLGLTDNLLDDNDATALARSLKTNTQLRQLGLAGNRITDVGVDALTTSVYDLSSMNALGRSNHTCLLDFGRQYRVHVNKHSDPGFNRKAKLVRALRTNLLWPHFRIEGVPPGIVPRVLALLQGGTSGTTKGLNDVFLFVRIWNMPRLFAGGTGPKLHRSKRRRRK